PGSDARLQAAFHSARQSSTLTSAFTGTGARSSRPILSMISCSISAYSSALSSGTTPASYHPCSRQLQM
ncbi:MAG TPA: hypothetical protein PLK88_00520, partial [Methanothrix sp.]|nr:hypothetical protein [Methanothrix sp.]